MDNTQRRPTRALTLIALVVVCVLFDVFTPFADGGACALRLVDGSVDMNALAPPVDAHGQAVERPRAGDVMADVVQVFPPDGPVSARTPAARPPPSR